MYHVYFEKELTDLQAEVMEHHPDVQVVLATLTDKDIYVQIAAIAVHCKMILHGDYTKADMLKICKKLTEKLVDMRTIHLHSSGIVDAEGKVLVSESKPVEPDASMMQSLPDVDGGSKTLQ